MVINENIRKIEDKIISEQYSGSNFKPIYINELNLTDGETYTISLDCEQTGDKTDGFSFNLYNMGTVRVIEKVGVFNKRNHMTFKYEEGKTYKINLYAGIHGEYSTSGARFYNFKLEQGDKATPYIPSKNSLDPSKQAIFKSGGGIPRGLSTLRLGVGYVS